MSRWMNDIIVQNYNRYGYCLNNPLKYVDYSGEIYGNEQNGGQPGTGGQIGIGNGLAFFADNWDKWGIKQWAESNFSARNFDNMGTKVSNVFKASIQSIGNWFGRNFKSIFGSDKPEIQPLATPQFSNFKNVRSWQEMGFANIKTGLPGTPTNSQAIIFPSLNKYMMDNTKSIADMNTTVGFAISAMEQVPGSFRLTNGAYNGNAFSFKYYASGWRGGSTARITTYSITGIAKNLGYVGAGVGTVLDAQGIANYYSKGPNDINSVSPNKAIFNAFMTVYGMRINPIPSLLYSGIDLFYPGGWTGDAQNPGLANDQHTLYLENTAINPQWQIWPGALKL